MKAILLCAGYATRLYPLTENQPKPLLPIAGKPMVEYLLDRVEKISGVDGIFLLSNDRFHSHFKKWAKDHQRYPWKIEVVNDGTRTNETRLGAIGDLAFVIKKYQLHDDLGVFAGDNLFNFDLVEFVRFAQIHRPHTSIAIVDVAKKELAQKYGIVQLDPNQKIIEFFEKPMNPPSTLASTGIYWFPKESLNFLDRYIREGHNADRLGDYISWLLKVERAFAYLYKGSWFDIGDLDSYREADRLFRESKSNTGEKKIIHEKK